MGTKSEVIPISWCERRGLIIRDFALRRDADEHRGSGFSFNLERELARVRDASRRSPLGNRSQRKRRIERNYAKMN